MTRRNQDVSGTRPARRVRAGGPLAAIVAVAVSLGGPLVLSGCSKTKTADCEKAVANIQKLTGTQSNDVGASAAGAIRACRGNSTPESVQCMIDAKTLEELENCEGGMFQKMFKDEDKDEPPAEPGESGQ